MVSIDGENEVAIWDLRELDVEPARVKVPIMDPNVLCTL
jgi:hypothetical protein